MAKKFSSNVIISFQLVNRYVPSVSVVSAMSFLVWSSQSYILDIKCFVSILLLVSTPSNNIALWFSGYQSSFGFWVIQLNTRPSNHPIIFFYCLIGTYWGRYHNCWQIAIIPLHLLIFVKRPWTLLKTFTVVTKVLLPKIVFSPPFRDVIKFFLLTWRELLGNYSFSSALQRVQGILAE